VHRLVQQHGGTITAQSEGLGTGAEFTVRLPLESGSPELQPVKADTSATEQVLVIKQVKEDRH
jgi:nitrogen-specific signal transduction histidine kinase